MKAAIYSRKSKFTGKGESIENQVQLCKDYAKSMGISEFEVYEDEGFSGKNIERPEFKRMLNDAKGKKFDILICYRLDRVSRNIADFSTLINELQELSIDFISIREQFDTSTPMGRAMMYIASVFAQLERETIAERVRDNMLELAKSGRWLGGQSPLGYNSEPITYFDAEMKQKKMYKLSPVPEELEVVKTIFNKYGEHKSLSQVTKYLLSHHIKTKNGCDWDKNRVKRILNNPVYVKSDNSIIEYLENLGIMVAGNPDGRHGLLTYNKQPRGKQKRDASEWIAAVGKQPGIIEPKEWLEVQQTLQANKDKAPRIGKTNNALLTGILKCEKCKSNMIIAPGHKSTVTGKVNYYYTCSMKKNSGKTRCDNANVRVDEVEQSIFRKLKEVSTNKGKLIEEIKKCREEAAASSDTTSQVENIKKQISDKELQIKNLVKQLSLDQSVTRYIIPEIEKLSKEVENLKIDLNKVTQKTAGSQKMKQEFDILIQLLDKFSVLDTYSYEEKKAWLNVVLDKIYWNGDTGELDIKLWGMAKKK